MEQIKQIKENYQESQQSIMDDKIKKFKTLAENLQKKHGVMIEEVKKKNQIILEKEEKISDMEIKMNQYKDIIGDSQKVSDLEEELEETKLKMTEQIIENQVKHAKEIEAVKDDFNKKLQNVEGTLKAEREAFKQQLQKLQDIGGSEELGALQNQLKEYQTQVQNEKNRAESYSKELEKTKIELSKKLENTEATLKSEREAFKQQLEHLLVSDSSEELIILQNQLKEVSK